MTVRTMRIPGIPKVGELAVSWCDSVQCLGPAGVAGEGDRSELGVDAELAQDRLDVAADGRGRHDLLAGDGVDAQSVDEGPEHVLLLAGEVPERVEAPALVGPGRVEAVEEVDPGACGHHALAPRRVTEQLDELVERLGLVEHAVGAGFEALAEQAGVALGGEDEDTGTPVHERRDHRGRQSFAAEVEVEDHDRAWPRSLGSGDDLVFVDVVAAHGIDRVEALEPEGHHQGVAHDVVVVDHEDRGVTKVVVGHVRIPNRGEVDSSAAVFDEDVEVPTGRILLSVTPGVLSDSLQRVLEAEGLDLDVLAPGSRPTRRYASAIVTSLEGIDADVVIELSERDGRRGTVLDRSGAVVSEVVIDLTSIGPLLELLDRGTEP